MEDLDLMTANISSTSDSLPAVWEGYWDGGDTGMDSWGVIWTYMLSQNFQKKHETDRWRVREPKSDSKFHHWVPCIPEFDYSFSPWMLKQIFKEFWNEMVRDRMNPWAAAQCHFWASVFEIQTEHPNVRRHDCSQTGGKKAHCTSRATFSRVVLGVVHLFLTPVMILAWLSVWFFSWLDFNLLKGNQGARTCLRAEL